MKRTYGRLRLSAASLPGVAALLMLLFGAVHAQAQSGNYCNNPIPPCDPNDPGSACYRPPDPPPKCEPKVCDKCTKSPCYVGSGVYSFDSKDLEIATTGFPITVSRLYQSTHTIDGESGIGWTSSLSTRLYYAVFLKSAPSTYQREADIRLPSGSVYRFVENANGSYTPPEGRFDTLVRNPDDTWDLWLQRTQSRYHFSATGNLLEMVDDYGNTQTWTYVSDRLQRIEDTSGSGRYIDITYGPDGRISDVTDLTGRNVHYVYSSAGVMSSATNPAAQVTAYSYTTGKYGPLLNGITDNWGRNVTSVVYDAQDRTRSYTDRGETYTYTYAFGGVSTTTAKSDSGGNTWQYPFGSASLVSDSRPPGGGPAEHIDYYANGLAQMHTDPLGVKTSYTYNSGGNRLTMTRDAQGATSVEWRYVYDSNFPSRLVSEIAYTPGTNTVHPHWQGKKYDYYPSGSVAPGAKYHEYRLRSDGVTADLVQTLTYDSHGRVLTDTDADGNTTTLTYDSFGNLHSVETPSNNDAGTKPVTVIAYDALGRRTGVTDPEGAVTAMTWDVLDRLLSQTLPKPSPTSPLTFITTYVYDDFDVASQLLFARRVDANGSVEKVGFDQYEQIIQRVDRAGNIDRYAFTKGLLTARTDPNGNVTSQTYDALHRLSRVTHPDGSYEQYGWNADNTKATIRDRKNQTISYGYDRLKRVVSISYPGGGTVTGTFQGQKLTQVVDSYASPTETHTLVWNDRFQLTSNTEGPRGAVVYTYTSSGRYASAANAAGAATSYGYYPDGSIRTLTWSPVSGVFKYDYTLNALPTTITFPNGQTRDFSYDGQHRLTGVQNVHPSTGTLAAFSYGYDVDAFTSLPNRLGLRTTVTADVPALSLSGAVTKYGYDAKYQMTMASYPSGSIYGGATASWTYDAMGNRTSATAGGSTATYAYRKYGSNPLNGPVLESDGSNAYTYDTNGNTISRSGAGGNYTFAYDDKNRLRSVAGAETAAYGYDHRSRRTTTTVSGATTKHLYDGVNRIADSGAETAEYLFGPRVDEPLAMLRDGTVSYYDVDGLGSVVALNDTAGAVQRSYAYDAWGETKGGTGTLTNPFGYASRELAQAGLYNNRYRNYQPSIGSFRSVDPMVAWSTEASAYRHILPATFPEYLYVNNNPASATDPFGLEPCESCKINRRKAYLTCLVIFTAEELVCTGITAACARNPIALLECAEEVVLCHVTAFTSWGICKTIADSDYVDCMKGCDCPPPPPPPPYQKA